MNHFLHPSKLTTKSEHATCSSHSEAFLQGDVRRSNAILIDHICNDIAAFVGPEGPNCNVEAMVAASKNRAMISYRCSDPEVSDKMRYPTFTRMEPPDTQVTTSVLALLKYHKWFKFTIVSQKTEQWMTIAEDLKNQAEMREEFTVNHFEEFEDYDKCCLHVSSQSKIVWIKSNTTNLQSQTSNQ